MFQWVAVLTTRSCRRTWFIEATDVSNCVLWVGDETGAKTRRDLPSSIWMQSYRNWLA